MFQYRNKFLVLAFATIFGALSCTTALAARVLLLADVPGNNTPALIAALQAAGHTVTVFAPEYNYSGTPSLADFDVVVHLDGDTYNNPMSVATQVALVQFVQNGGGFVGAQWLGYEESTNRKQTNMSDLVLLSHNRNGGQNCSNCSITYTAVPGQESHPVLAGLPASFTFTALSHDASPKTFTGNPPMPLMTIQTGAPGVLVRKVEAGHVVNFSVAVNYEDPTGLLLQNQNWQRLYVNAVGWAVGNRPPTAVIAPQGAVHAGDLVALDGSGSTDPDGNALTYRWTLVSQPVGSGAVLSDPSAILPNFTADKTGDYQVSLVVNDGRVDSAAATLLISSLNGAPVADAGPDQLITLVGTQVQLDGSASFDPDGDALTYVWTLVSAPTGSAAALDNPAAVAPGFVADVNGQYLLTMQVTDRFGASVTDDVEVSFNNLAPVANAGADQAPLVGSSVTLPGSGSDANGDPLTFRWSLLSIPAGSTAALMGAATDTAGFTADTSGTYVAQLIVNDGIVDSAPDTVTVQAGTARDAATATLQELIAYLSGVPLTDAQGQKVYRSLGAKKALTRHLQTALRLIEHGHLREALKLLGQDLRRLDGCARTGAADRNDWIRVCQYQTPVYNLLTETIKYLQEVSRGGRIRFDRDRRDHDRHVGHDRDGARRSGGDRRDR